VLSNRVTSIRRPSILFHIMADALEGLGCC
jgi:hypothetical protein